MNKRFALHIILFTLCCCSFQEIQAATYHEFTIVTIESDTLNVDTSNIKSRYFNDLKETYTVVIVTHNMQQAARVSQKTAYFHLGKLVEMGDTKQIFTNPRHELTENYISGRFG